MTTNHHIATSPFSSGWRRLREGKMAWRPLGTKKKHRLFAISGDGIGILANTLAPTRREAIALFQIGVPEGSFALDWSAAKHAGYRTVLACLEITDRDGNKRRRPFRPDSPRR